MDRILDIYLLSGTAYLIYLICMGKQVSYTVKRWFLLLTMGAAGIVPFVEISLETKVAQQVFETLHSSLPKEWIATRYLQWIYGAGVLWMGIRLGYQLHTIHKRMRQQIVRQYPYRGFQVLECAREKGNEFSFFGKIVISAHLNATEKECILLHELSHVQHRHSTEKLLMEIIKVLLWFNPFVYIAAIHIDELQEYQADADVLASGIDRKAYITLIVEQVITSALPVTSKFYSYFTKSRFQWMLHPPIPHKRNAVVAFTSILCVMILFSLRVTGQEQTPASIPQFATTADSLEMTGSLHIYTPDPDKFKHKTPSVPEPDEQVLMIVK